MLVALAALVALVALVAGLTLIAGPDQRRLFGFGAVLLDDEIADDGVVEAECALHFFQHRLAALDVHQDVVGLVDLVDRIGQLPPAPVLQPVNLAAILLDHRAIAIHHRLNLIALVGMDHEYDFIMTHVGLPTD